MAVADRLGLHFSAPQAMFVEEGLERPAHEQRLELEYGGLFVGIHDRGH